MDSILPTSQMRSASLRLAMPRASAIFVPASAQVGHQNDQRERSIRIIAELEACECNHSVVLHSLAHVAQSDKESHSPQPQEVQLHGSLHAWQAAHGRPLSHKHGGFAAAWQASGHSSAPLASRGPWAATAGAHLWRV